MKRLLLIFVLFALSSTSFAQLPVSLGVKFGLNSTKLNTSSISSGDLSYSLDDFKSDASNGYNVGAFARVKLGKMYLQPELLYAVKKGETSFNVNEVSTTDLTDGITQTMELKTIEVPMLVGVKLLDLKLASVRAFTGPAVSFIMNDSSIDLSKQGIDNLEHEVNFKNSNWDWQLGAGVDIAMFTFDVRYAWGLTNVADVSSVGDVSKIGIENKGDILTFSLGFKFF